MSEEKTELVDAQGPSVLVRNTELMADKIEHSSDVILRDIVEEERKLTAFYTDMSLAPTKEGMVQTVEEEMLSLKNVSVNLGKAIATTTMMQDELGARWHDLHKGKKKKGFLRSPANGVIDIEELQSDHFAKGINFYKLALLCSIGSFVGVIIELLWCLVTRGYIESRSGLIYGPFNLLYGAGAVALTVVLYRYRNRGSWMSFCGGFVVGSILEYACSFFQELIFGSRSWDYSRMPFNINGRICLAYSVFWGVLGVFWIKSLYPRIAKGILKIPQKAGKIITWALVVFFAVNSVITYTAMWRWKQRLDGVAPSNELWEFVDEHYPNERMEGVFANMKFD